MSRRRWLFTHLAIALLESFALSLFAVIVIGSAVVHQTYFLSQVLLHTVFMGASEVFMIAYGNLGYTLFPGSYLSLLRTLVLLGGPYLWLQTYMQHLRDLGRAPWLGYLDFAHTITGPWHLSWRTMPWVLLLVA